MSLYTNLSHLNIKSCRNVNLFNYSENKIHTPSVSQYHIITPENDQHNYVSMAGHQNFKCQSAKISEFRRHDIIMSLG